MNANNIVATATELQQNHNKLELVGMARGLGWKGDHARAPVLQLALFIATKLNAGERSSQQPSSQQQGGDSQQQGQQQQQQQSSESSEGQQQGQQQQQQSSESSEGQQGEGQQQGKAPQGQQQSQQSSEGQQGDEGQQPQQSSEGDEAAAAHAWEQQQQKAEQEGRERAERAERERDEAEQRMQQGRDEGGEGQQPEPQQMENDDDEPEQPEANEFKQLLAASGIQHPHRMLEKAWLLTAKAKQNLLLIGPAGCGKTMLAEQVAQLLRVPFGSVSCTMGMSESQLTGWLLPVGEGGRFDYVPAPFVTCLQQSSVFLLDELDAADPNVLMIANSVLSNGFVSVPHKLGAPMVLRSSDAIIIAGANTFGTGADDLYTARAALDGATVDRFYPLVIDYDEAFEHGLFNRDRRSRRKSSPWVAGAIPDQLQLDALRTWFVALRKATQAAKINRIVSTRLAKRLVAAVSVGVPVDEVKRDLLTGWSADELARCKVGF
jgi:MoxR-like ATPase